MRALSCVAKSRSDIPPAALNAGMAGLLAVGVHAFLAAPWAEIKPLLDEMFTCVRRVEDVLPMGRALVDDDVEEITTRAWLRQEVLDLHLGFFKDARAVDMGIGGVFDNVTRNFIEYPNTSRAQGAVISARLAKLHELQTIYSVEDLYGLYEILTVDWHNEREAARTE